MYDKNSKIFEKELFMYDKNSKIFEKELFMYDKNSKNGYLCMTKIVFL